ncbi:MAG: L-serine ammonia-lyase, iron-sulfur-dependent, subunit alpha [Tetragenococcus halophilus]|uniref:L-serine dehydratase n=2 Tax=Tetragenococcus halophilus TaxID=51669 RepID=A0AAN1SEE5_TETHN|nr:L-serine ammonia-lyase, iron-sulfur-dependent, subunit alpha [Tetragenococcus halophilus]MDN6195792.1 L-serine ammonia-lyase, iron-sulfur-dependent, subunit alpha [Atopostipes suicloacalis]MDN6497482.1 L-serine ammonia-lyase, iron-sulfur-dependent, subunit alpha [Tetragenococcus koreensis]MDN6836349.1 L-serine ammonia-lyase, iron-sulfur-dependent, subunit alpha [Lactococcus lactis]MDN5831965.1 L-serine ammonia-lyase, iron-sulfur-dependent, subunit alpha [Tetragenococcus halophilus]MDN611319
MYYSIAEFIEDAEQKGKSLSDLMIEQEMAQNQVSFDEVWNAMDNNLKTMEEAVKNSISDEGAFSPTGLTGGDALKLKKYRENHRSLSGDTMLKSVQSAIGTNETNAAMGVICATPTAGASGTLPGVIFSIQDSLNLSREQKVRFLFTAGLFGMVVANNAMIAGATGGCQAEVGSASAMAAAAAVEAASGTPQQSSEAFAIALSNLLGLVCDPVAGLVELPCVKRNAIGSGNALIAADMALAEIDNKIPADEVVESMRRIGSGLPRELRETGLGGLAATQTGKRMKEEIFGHSS